MTIFQKKLFNGRFNPTSGLLLGLICVTIFAMGCYRPDRYTIVIEVPKMAGPTCGKVILDALNKIDGVGPVVPDYDGRTVTVTYRNVKLAKKNIEYTITGVGFEANGNPPKPEAAKKLPKECQ